jgi:arabinose-5-phosphate isomerase
MTRSFFKVALGTRVVDAVDVLRAQKISELPVVDAEGRPVGLLDITDLIALFPAEDANSLAA